MKKRMRRTVFKRRQVLIGTPCRKDWEADDRVCRFIAKAVARGIADYYSVGTDWPEYGRNTIIKDFLENPKHRKRTHLFLLDSDTCPVDDFAIEKLLLHNKDVIAGVTPIVRFKDDVIDCMWSAMLKKPDTSRFDNIGICELPSSLFKADRIGGTTILLSRRVLMKLKEPYQKTKFTANGRSLELGEDMFFSDKLREEAGTDIWVDPTIECHHYHRVDLLDVFSIWRKAKKTA